MNYFYNKNNIFLKKSKSEIKRSKPESNPIPYPVYKHLSRSAFLVSLTAPDLLM